MILFSILLPLLVLAPAAPAPPAGLAGIQAKATAAHKAYRDRSKGAQRCDPQTTSAATAANRLAIAATQRRWPVLTAISQRAQQSAAWTPPADSTDGELTEAIGLLMRDMETSAAMLAKATPGASASASGLREIMAQSEGLPRVEVLKAEMGGQASQATSGLSTLASDLAIEESLINAYFTGSKAELERVCMEKPAGGEDPFRVPARAAKPAAARKKGQR
jgi:hypothetical protein